MEKYPEIIIYNFSQRRIPARFCKETTKSIFKILKKDYSALSLIFVSASEMRILNRYWRHKDKPTTVLTFSEGDIFLCPLEIKKQALQRKISLKRFYQILLIHSILHLLGYTHDNPRDAKKMEKLESKLLAKIQ